MQSAPRPLLTSILRRTLAVFCLLAVARASAQERLVRLDEATARPGETVDVPIHVQMPELLEGYAVAIRFDRDRLDFQSLSLAGSPWDGALSGSSFSKVYPSGDVTVGAINAALNEAFRPQPIDASGETVVGRLVFRVRATAQPGLAEVVAMGESPGTQLDSELQYNPGSGIRSALPDRSIAGSVRVVEPDGPRPVGDLSCEQYLDRVVLRFERTEDYSRVEVRRDGELRTTVAGDVTEIVDPLEGLSGDVAYTVTGIIDGRASFPVRCELQAGSPVAPRVVDLACTDGNISWSNAAAYDRIEIYRDDALIAELPGDASSFRDPAVSDEQAIYTLIASVEGIASAPARCLVNGIWALEVGDVQALADADQIVVPIYATTSAAVQGIAFELEVDLERFNAVTDPTVALQGSGFDPTALDYLGIGPNPVSGLPGAGIIYDIFPPLERDRFLQIGVRRRVFNFVLEPKMPLQAGEVLPVELTRATGQTIFTLYDEDTRETIRVDPDLLIGGRIFVGDNGVAPLTGLEVHRKGSNKRVGDNAEPTVELAWQNGESYDRVVLERDGSFLAELPGSETTYVDREVPRGIHQYKAIGVRNGDLSFPSSTVFVVAPPPGTFVRGDVNFDGERDTSDVVGILLHQFVVGFRVPCPKAADVDDNGALETTDAIFLLSHLFLDGRSIAPPGPGVPFLDPTADDLPCHGPENE